MSETSDVIIYLVFPLFTLGVVGIGALVVSSFRAVGCKVDKMHREFTQHQLNVISRLSILETKIGEKK